MTAVGAKLIHTCPYGCRIKLTVPMYHVVEPDGSLAVDLDTEQLVAAINAHMRGMHA